MYKFKTITKNSNIFTHLTENDENLSSLTNSKIDLKDLQNSVLPNEFKMLSKSDLKELEEKGRISITFEKITTLVVEK